MHGWNVKYLQFSILHKYNFCQWLHSSHTFSLPSEMDDSSLLQSILKFGSTLLTMVIMWSILHYYCFTYLLVRLVLFLYIMTQQTRRYRQYTFYWTCYCSIECSIFSNSFVIWQVFDSLSYNGLSKSNALLQHASSFCAGSGEVPKHAQGSYIWNQW